MYVCVGAHVYRCICLSVCVCICVHVCACLYSCVCMHACEYVCVSMCVLWCVVFVLMGKVLETCTDSTVPWWDSFTTALSIIAMWMLAHKYVEQWLVWLVVDIVSCGLYIYKDLYFTSFLYGFYAVIAFSGYLKWKQLMNSADERV